jgi:hypothetical protein
MATLLIAVAWMYVVVMMAAAEATSSSGTLLGALVTLVLYGLLPLGIVLYIAGTPMRRRARRRAATVEDPKGGSAADPDGRGHAASDAIAPKREET